MGKVDLARRLQDARARVDEEAPVEERGLAKFARLTRKDARVRADQDAALTALVKSLMRRRRVKAERITENTLIRVAIDLLLAHADQLRGSTEDELRESVTSALRNSRTPVVPDTRTPEHPESRRTDVSQSRIPAVTHPQAPGLADSGASIVPRPATPVVPDADARPRPGTRGAPPWDPARRHVHPTGARLDVSAAPHASPGGSRGMEVP